MYKYKIYGLIFETDIEFSECERIETDESAVVTIRSDELSEMVRDVSLQEVAYSKKLSPDDEMPSKYSKKEGDIYYSYIVGTVYLKITGDNLVEYKAIRSVDDIVFRQWMLCYAMTLALIKKHEIILHCAGLLVPGTDEAILVCGDSGAGKSTISNALLDKGLKFISDDSVRVAAEGGVTKVFGSYMQRRLCEDVVNRGTYDKSKLEFFEEGERQKWVVNMGDQYYGNTPHTLNSIFFLSLKDSGNVEIKEVLGAEKIKSVMRALYKTGAYKAEGLTTELFVKFAEISKGLRFYIIERPSDRMTVDAITDLIIETTKQKA